jgi:hypothetical protein
MIVIDLVHKQRYLWNDQYELSLLPWTDKEEELWKKDKEEFKKVSKVCEE